jgi:hypothetical protein
MIRFALIQLLSAALLLAAASGTAQAQRSGQAGDNAVLDLDFDGGTAAQYIDQIRRKVVYANIVADPGVDLVEMLPVQLKRVSLHQALALLDGMSAEGEDHQIVLDLGILPGEDSMTVYKIEAKGRTFGERARRDSRIWSLQQVIAHGYTASDVLTAVEISLEMIENTQSPADVRFHEDTALLIVRGHPSQLDAINALVSQLTVSPARHERDEQARSRLEQTQLKLVEAQADAARFHEKATAARDEADQLARQVTEWQTRAQLYRDELESMRKRYEQRLQELQAILGQRENAIQQLEVRVAELERSKSRAE